MEFKDILKYIAAVGGSLITYLFGGWTLLIQALLALVILDYVTGILSASVRKEVSSRIGFEGIARKVYIFLLVAAGHLADIVLGANNIIQNAVIYFYMANELFSILENAGKVGLPVPDILSTSAKALQGKEKKANTDIEKTDQV